MGVQGFGLVGQGLHGQMLAAEIMCTGLFGHGLGVWGRRVVISAIQLICAATALMLSSYKHLTIATLEVVNKESCALRLDAAA